MCPKGVTDMPRYKTDQTSRYVRIDSNRVDGKPTSQFVLRYEYGNPDTFLLFRVYKRKLSANDKTAGFPDTVNYAVADLHTTQPEKAKREAQKLVEQFGTDMKIKFIGKE